MNSNLATALLLLCTQILLSGCVAPTEFERAADQGVSFQDAFLEYSRSTRRLSTHARQLSMATTVVPMEPGADRIDVYERFRAGIADELEVYSLITAHSTAMRTYFKQLQSLASSDTAKDSAAAVGETITTLNSLTASLGAAGISSNASTIVGELVQGGVSIRQRALLSQALQAQGEVIEANLLLQLEALAFIDSKVKQDVESTAREQENLLLQTLNEVRDIDPQALADSATAVALAKSVKPGASATGAARRMLESWRDLMRRAAGELTLEELFASLKDLQSELKALEATTTAITGILD